MKIDKSQAITKAKVKKLTASLFSPKSQAITKSKVKKLTVDLCALSFVFIAFLLLTSLSGCKPSPSAEKEPIDYNDTISELSFAPDGKRVVFDRCKSSGCQIQVYNLETGELAAYQSPAWERWTMGKYSDDGKRITFSVIPGKRGGGLDLSEMQIAVMDADGKNFKKVTTGYGAKLYPTFSHNGKKILYACAALIRKHGKTPAGNYDAWEVNLETGEQTQRTFHAYYYLGYLNYYPDDETFLFQGEMPAIYEDVGAFRNEAAFKDKMLELAKEGKGIAGVVVMKGNELQIMPYNFGPNFFPGKPMLTRDGNTLIFEKMYSGGKFYQHSADGKHRLVGEGGSVDAAAISPDGELLGMIAVDTTIHIITTKDANRKLKMYLPCAPKSIENFEDAMKKSKFPYKMIPGKPLKILNQ